YIGQYLAVEDTAGVSPFVQLTAPSPGGTVIEGETITLRAEATDDVAVASVSFLVDGTLVRTDTTSSYQTQFTVPLGVQSVTVGASAIDLGSNVGVAADVTINVIPDPLTTVVGRVIDRQGNPVVGATVTSGGQASITGSDGAFSIAGVPTISG